MLEKTVEPITPQEKLRLGQPKRLRILSRMFGSDAKADSGPSEGFVDVYRITVEKCLILQDFNEEHPLYFLDTGGTLVILFGQWIYDLNVPEALFEKWIPDQTFFQKLHLRCSAKRGIAFWLKADGQSFIPVQRLANRIRFSKLSECQFIPGSAETLVSDLRNAGIIAP